MTHATIINDRRTALRLANLKRLIAELQVRPMTRLEIAAYLGLSDSGARGYMEDLQPLLVATPGAIPRRDRHTYRIVDAVAAAAFVPDIGGSRRAQQESDRTALAIARRNPARRFHILADDDVWTIKVARGIPQQWAVVAAFFAMGQVGACV